MSTSRRGVPLRILTLATAVLVGCVPDDPTSARSESGPTPNANANADANANTVAKKTPQADPAGKKTPPATAPAFTIEKKVAHGCIEDHGGLRVIRLWGTPEERGTAHAELVGKEAIDLVRRELTARFGNQPDLLKKARGLLNLIVGYPKSVRRELTALFESVKAQKIDLAAPGLGRDLDLKDLLGVNAMDLLVQMGCSGFSAWGDQVEGGGVLTARNFDWPMTGPYLVENCCLIVQHPVDGAANVAVAWPGYVGSVTGINEHGVAAFLHFGDSNGGWPRPGSYSSATAAREILQEADAPSAFEVSRDLIGKTSPPKGYLTRIVSPVFVNNTPVRVFEADAKGVTHRKTEELCVVTNHFLSRGERQVSRDSKSRFDKVSNCLQEELAKNDRKISVAEAWDALASVERGGRRFGTQHSLVFRFEPWVFELAIGKLEGGALRAAPSHGRKFRISREALFRKPE